MALPQRRKARAGLPAAWVRRGHPFRPVLRTEDLTVVASQGYRSSLVVIE
jgi:hypothetical protein